jgi:hypothetical protein
MKEVLIVRGNSMPIRLQWVISSPVWSFKCEPYFVVASPNPDAPIGVPFFANYAAGLKVTLTTPLALK